MKFITSSTEICVARIGILTEFERIPNIKFETPLALVYTKGGSIPHLTKDAFKLITSKPQILSTSLPSTYLMFDSVKNTDNNFAEFVGMKEHINFLTLQDPAYATPFRYFRGFDSIPVWTKCGKHELTPNKYMDIIEAFKPDMYVALCDGGTHKNSSQKRIIKAVRRSETFFENCLAKHCSSETLKSSQVLGAVEGGYDKKARTLSVNYLKDKPIVGYVIDGLHSNGPNVKNISTEEIKEIVEYTINLLPVEKLKVSMGCWNPLTVLDLVELGVDIFDTTYAYQITENLEALTFLCNHTNCNVGHVISFTEERYADDFSPICSHCKCFTCKNHNKAYLYHLCNTKEMLFSVLLMIHNVHQYFEFFEAIRENIKRDELTDTQSAKSTGL